MLEESATLDRENLVFPAEEVEGQGQGPEEDPVCLSASEAPEDWARIYADASPGMLLGEVIDLQQHILDVTQEEFDRRFDLGMYEIIGSGGTYVVPDSDDEIVSNVRITGVNDGGEVRKVVLPEAEFSDLYLMKKKIGWLRREARLRGVKDR